MAINLKYLRSLKSFSEEWAAAKDDSDSESLSLYFTWFKLCCNFFVIFETKVQKR